MSDDRRVELAGRQRKWLDALPLARRHVMSDVFHRDRHALLVEADLMDRPAGLTVTGRPTARRGTTTPWLRTALNAEALRAIVRDDHERVRELFEACGRYDPEMGARGIKQLDLLDEAAAPWRERAVPRCWHG